MKATLSSPEDVAAALERISTTQHHNINVNTDREREDFELKIDFDPPRPPIRITSPDLLFTLIPTVGLETRNYHIDAASLADVLRQSAPLLNGHKMTHLTLNKLDLRQSMDAFWTVFGDDCCSQLRHVVAKTCVIPPNQWVQLGLSQVPRLDTLHLENVLSLPPPPGLHRPLGLTLPNVTWLLHQKRDTLRDVILDSVEVPSLDLILDLCHAVGQCSTLRRFSCDFYSEGVDSCTTSEKRVNECIGQTIAEATSLGELTLPVQGKASLEPIALGLARNVGLKTLRLSTLTDHQQVKIEEGHENPEVMALCDAAATNLTLEKLEFKRQGLQWQNFCTERYEWPLMMDNHKDPNQMALEQLQFYLHLNSIGRRPFLSQSPHLTTAATTTRADWINMVVKHRKNESVTFYFLQLNPSIYFM
ncbi:expressed unknown protein [Seminavis robusta]|uniref:Uncharacterized protein n=1 Tax=Seminavis robusta TaxID=568900 RepID=A0A9N8E3A5_9STRA|nr:expressed unknown protein [Seminavis robusta]|eukprot:Sro482_g151850.1 n/a (418) ;mRNA; r:39552-40805